MEFDYLLFADSEIIQAIEFVVRASKALFLNLISSGQQLFCSCAAAILNMKDHILVGRVSAGHMSG